MHPHRLHATAAAWSLRLAREALTAAANQERAQNIAEQFPAADILRSPSWNGSRRTTGDHGDPTGVSAAYPHVSRETWWADLSARADQRITWIASQLAPGIGDPLWRIIDRIPSLMPGTAAVLARHLQDEDRWLREALSLGEFPGERGQLGRLSCPACKVRRLEIQTAAPDAAQWTVICGAGCLCSGAGCACGMPGAVEGVAHIWLRSAVIAGVTPTTLAA